MLFKRIDIKPFKNSPIYRNGRLATLNLLAIKGKERGYLVTKCPPPQASCCLTRLPCLPFFFFLATEGLAPISLRNKATPGEVTCEGESKALLPLLSNSELLEISCLTNFLLSQDFL